MSTASKPDLQGSDDPVIIQNPISPGTWNLNQNIRNIRLIRDQFNNAWAIPVIIVNPQTNPVVAGGNIGNVVIQDGTTNALARVSGFAGAPVNENLAALASLLVTNTAYLYRADTGNFDLQEEATLISTVVLPNAGSTQLVAAGGVSKKIKIFRMTLSASAVAGAVTINEITAGTILAGVNGVGAAAGQAIEVDCGPNGILQPTANNGIQVTTAGAQLGYATIVYGVAR